MMAVFKLFYLIEGDKSRVSIGGTVRWDKSFHSLGPLPAHHIKQLCLCCVGCCQLRYKPYECSAASSGVEHRSLSGALLPPCVGLPRVTTTRVKQPPCRYSSYPSVSFTICQSGNLLLMGTTPSGRRTTQKRCKNPADSKTTTNLCDTSLNIKIHHQSSAGALAGKSSESCLDAARHSLNQASGSKGNADPTSHS